jgi:hypothetical protein
MTVRLTACGRLQTGPGALAAGLRYIYGPARAVKGLSNGNTLRDRCNHIFVYGLLPICKPKIDER